MSASGLRILITCDAVGGVWQYSLDLARELAAAGTRPTLAVLGPAPDAGQRSEADAIDGVDLFETGLPLDWLSDGPEPVIAAATAVSALAHRCRADVVHLNTPTLAAAMPDRPPTVAVAHGCVATWWEVARPGNALDPSFHWHRTMMRKGLIAADRVVAPSASYARTVQRHYALDSVPLVVHNGRSQPAQLAQRPVENEAFTAGRLWDAVKRADILDRVGARLTVPFRAAGAAIGPNGERAQLNHLDLLGQMNRDSLTQHLARRPVFVSAASFEPFGLAVLEAAQAGCALVLSDIDTFRELWDGAALFVAGENEAAYVDAIQALLANPVQRLRLGEAARRRAALYRPQRMAEHMLAIYADVLREGSRRGRAAA